MVNIIFVTKTPAGSLQLEDLDVQPQESAAGVWLPLGATETLGFSLKAQRISDNPHRNSAICVLTFGSDPASPTFAKAAPKFGHDSQFAYASAMVARADGEDPNRDLFDFILLYVSGVGQSDFSEVHMAEITRDEQRMEAVKAVIARKMSSQAFAYHLDQSRQSEAALGRKRWTKEEQPVKVSTLVCGVCSKSGSSAEVKLSVCSQCQIRHYCGKERQKKDWKAHKKACGLIKAAKDAPSDASAS